MPHLVSLKVRRDYRAKRGTKAVKTGETLHFIKSGDRYFAWCYRSETFARQMVAKLDTIRTGADWAANWKTDPKQCATSDRETF